MWSHENIARILIDFSLKSSNQSFIGDHRIYENKNADLKNDIGLDSIEMMQLAAYANNFFNLYSIKDPPYLLSYTKISDWVDLIYEARKRSDESLKFQTSGTSGNTKIIEHSIPFLKREISFLADLFINSTQIVTLVPSYSIYGFLFTIGLPAYLKLPVIYSSQINWHHLTPGTLIVATPFQWQLLVNDLPSNLSDIYGVTAAAAMHQALFSQIRSKNIKLTEIYGSTETAGVGYRLESQNPFTLFPYWHLNGLNEDIELEDQDNFRLYQLMDHINLYNNQTFSVVGRKDQQIKVAGHLVNLDLLKNKIETLPTIKRCTLSAKADNNGTVIQATIMLLKDTEELRLQTKKEIRDLLHAHERPRIFYFTTD
jgi:4-coumarate--CoA ligase (photoactive yellow protein activation family)